MTFGTANDYCNSRDAHLCYITSPEEQIAIGLYLNSNNINGKVIPFIPTF